MSSHTFERREIIITGFGGQGIILAGRILGEAAVIGDHREGTFVQSYGPEARGGECSAQIIISGAPIHYPYIRRPDILACMSQGGYDKYIERLQENGALIIDEHLVNPRGTEGVDHFAVPATRMAEELGRVMMANIILLGYLTAVTEAVSLDAVRSAVRRAVPHGTEEMNTKAFHKGHEFGLATLKGLRKKAAGRTVIGR